MRPWTIRTALKGLNRSRYPAQSLQTVGQDQPSRADRTDHLQGAYREDPAGRPRGFRVLLQETLPGGRRRFPAGLWSAVARSPVNLGFQVR